MRKKIARWSIILIAIIGCRTITANFPRHVSSIELDNGVKVTLELNEDLMVFFDPIVTKKLTIDYGNYQSTYRTTNDHYNLDIMLVKRGLDPVWIVWDYDWYESAECSFNKKGAEFKERFTRIPEGVVCDTLFKVKYENFIFSIE